ncbi:MAG: hypothetical protein ABIO88_10865 [Burkholderiaceae bacterium]
MAALKQGVLASFLAAMLSMQGCGDSANSATPEISPNTAQTPAAIASVQYVGDTLYVHGIAYPRVADDPRITYVAGELLAEAKVDQKTSADDMLKKFNLNVIQTLGTGAYLIAVPAQFEQQWVKALTAQVAFEYAQPNYNNNYPQ